MAIGSERDEEYSGAELAAWLQEAGRRTRSASYVPAADEPPVARRHGEYQRARLLTLLLVLTFAALGYGYVDLQIRIDALPVITAFVAN